MLDQRVQAKLHAELDQLDSEAAIGLSDKSRMHYTNAVINVKAIHFLKIFSSHNTNHD
jgi:hypothetical protein